MTPRTKEAATALGRAVDPLDPPDVEHAEATVRGLLASDRIRRESDRAALAVLLGLAPVYAAARTLLARLREPSRARRVHVEPGRVYRARPVEGRKSGPDRRVLWVRSGLVGYEHPSDPKRLFKAANVKSFQEWAGSIVEPEPEAAPNPNPEAQS